MASRQDLVLAIIILPFFFVSYLLVFYVKPQIYALLKKPYRFNLDPDVAWVLFFTFFFSISFWCIFFNK